MGNTIAAVFRAYRLSMSKDFFLCLGWFFCFPLPEAGAGVSVRPPVRAALPALFGRFFDFCICMIFLHTEKSCSETNSFVF